MSLTRRRILQGIAVLPLACTTKTPTSGGPWATGGTKAMTGAYPDPFANGLGAPLTLACAATIGPCYAKSPERKDISESQDGLPVRLAFLLVDTDGKPVPNASMDIWHCAPNGLYSGEDADDFCTSGDKTARAHRWFRGTQTSDLHGRIDFDTCFPGWYRGRTIHIHFTVRENGQEYLTSQLVFDDALGDEIMEGQRLYAARGKRDTKNGNDGVMGGDLRAYTLVAQRMPDGAMLASKAIMLRKSTTEALCAIPGRMGPPPPRGSRPGP